MVRSGMLSREIPAVVYCVAAGFQQKLLLQRVGLIGQGVRLTGGEGDAVGLAGELRPLAQWGLPANSGPSLQEAAQPCHGSMHR